VGEDEPLGRLDGCELVAEEREPFVHGGPGGRALAAAAVGEQEHGPTTPGHRRRVQEEEIRPALLCADRQRVVEPGEQRPGVVRLARRAEGRAAEVGAALLVVLEAHDIRLGGRRPRQATVEAGDEGSQLRVRAIDADGPAEDGEPQVEPD
jgi:hypothetical protein